MRRALKAYSNRSSSSQSNDLKPSIPQNKSFYQKGFEEFERRVDKIIEQNQEEIDKEMRTLKDNLHINMGDGSRYKGKQKNNKRQGIGQNLFQNGITYRGFFVEDKMHGPGVLIKNSRTIFQGTFKENKFVNFGKRSYENGDVYKGEFEDGARQGTGVYMYANGDKYYGEFFRHKKQGQGQVKESVTQRQI